MALGGILHRVNYAGTNIYHLYDEREEFVGRVMPIPAETSYRHFNPDNKGSVTVQNGPGWYGRHENTGHVTMVHPDHHKAAKELMDHHARTRADLGLEA